MTTAPASIQEIPRFIGKNTHTAACINYREAYVLADFGHVPAGHCYQNSVSFGKDFVEESFGDSSLDAQCGQAGEDGSSYCKRNSLANQFIPKVMVLRLLLCCNLALLGSIFLTEKAEPTALVSATLQEFFGPAKLTAAVVSDASNDALAQWYLARAEADREIAFVDATPAIDPLTWTTLTILLLAWITIWSCSEWDWHRATQCLIRKRQRRAPESVGIVH